METQIMRSRQDIESFIRKERERQGLTRYRLSQIAGVRWRTLDQIERGISSNPSLSMILRICDALQAPIQIKRPKLD